LCFCGWKADGEEWHALLGLTDVDILRLRHRSANCKLFSQQEDYSIRPDKHPACIILLGTDISAIQPKRNTQTLLNTVHHYLHFLLNLTLLYPFAVLINHLFAAAEESNK
jgi:hypothetical protein